jgi:endoglycosylceramidase
VPARSLTNATVFVAISLSAAVVIAGCSKELPAKPRAAPTGIGFVGHSGRWMTDPAGQVLILHGLNMVYKQPPYEPSAAGFGDAAATTLSDDGFDIVRLGVIYSAVEPAPGVYSEAYVDSIAQTVAELARRGIYSLLDFHQDQMSTEFGGEGFPSWSVLTDGLAVRHYIFPLGYTESSALGAAFNSFWSDSPGPAGVGIQHYYAGAWAFVARHFAGDPSVVGYDLFNEPWPAGSTDAQLGSFYSLLIASIRHVDKKHLLFYEPYVTFDFGAKTTLPEFSDTDLGMSFHDYCLGEASAEPTACSRSEAAVITNALTRSDETGAALLLSEFGATSNLTDLTRVVRDADSHQISWIEWAYCGCGDPTGTIPASIEGLVSDPALPGTGSNIDAAKLDVLAEPYPRIVSGTPSSYSFDPTSRKLTFSYSTVSPGGRAFGAGACTALVITPVEYPGGYLVSAVGARVTSAPGSGVLTLAQDDGARAVTVEVRPTTGGSTSDPAASAFAGCS